ncbi:MAG: MerR family transcriptional regulator [Myxococcota bacterium]
MASRDTNPGFSIRVASRMTGLSPHTLRMWERRYGFPEPARTDAGARRYTKTDVERLRLIAKALEHGYRPGEVVDRSLDELKELVAEQLETTADVSLPGPTAPTTPVAGRIENGAPPSVADTVNCIRTNDADGLRERLRTAAAILGPRAFLASFAHPLLVQIGALWRQGEVSVHQEHFATELLATQLRAMLAGYENRAGKPEVLLATLPEEKHGLGLLMVALYLSVVGGSARLLGIDMPVDGIVEATRTLNIDVVGLSVTRANVPSARTHIQNLLPELPRRVELWLGGDGAPALDIEDPAVHILDSFFAIDERVAAWRKAALT